MHAGLAEIDAEACDQRPGKGHHDGTVEGYWLVPCLSNMNVVTVELQLPSHSMAMLEGTPESIILRSSLLVRELGVSPDVVQKVRHHRGEEAAKDLFFRLALGASVLMT